MNYFAGHSQNFTLIVKLITSKLKEKLRALNMVLLV